MEESKLMERSRWFFDFLRTRILFYEHSNERLSSYSHIATCGHASTPEEKKLNCCKSEISFSSFQPRSVFLRSEKFIFFIYRFYMGRRTSPMKPYSRKFGVHCQQNLAFPFRANIRNMTQIVNDIRIRQILKSTCIDASSWSGHERTKLYPTEKKDSPLMRGSNDLCF
jgi:hypothetical protein